MIVDTQTRKERQAEGWRVRQGMKNLMPLMFRLQRRPLTQGPEFNLQKTVISVRALSTKALSRMTALAQQCLDKSGWSIFRKNCGLILKRSSSIFMMNVNFKNPLFAIKGFEKIVMRRIRQWAATLRKAGIMMILRVRVVASASESLIETLESAQKWSKKDVWDMACPCSTHAADDMRRIEGHVAQPLMEWAKMKIDAPAPRGWTVRSRCVPSFLKLMGAVKDTLEVLTDRFKTRLEKRGLERLRTRDWSIPWSEREGGLLELWQNAMWRFPGAWTVEEVLPLKLELKPFAVSPVDKLGEDGLIMRPVRWARR
jgi:hypothetical protein